LSSETSNTGLTTRASVKAEERLHEPDYVEARGLLLPATEYLQRGVYVATEQGVVTGYLLSTISKATIDMFSR